MRCPDCNKFVSLETQEPEVGDLTISYGDMNFTVHADGRTSRNCAECSQELKALDWDDEVTLELSEFDNFDKLNEKQVAQLHEWLNDGQVEADIDETGVQADESGGHRYQKNIITSRVEFDVTIERPSTWDDAMKAEWPKSEDGEPLKLTMSSSIESANAASEFEEQV